MRLHNGLDAGPTSAFAQRRSAREALPLPDTSWMSEPIKRDKFYAWLKPAARA